MNDQAVLLYARAPVRPAVDAWPTYGADIAATATEITRSAVLAQPAVTLTEEWQAPADGAVSGEPVALNGHVYYGTWGDSVYSVDELTGEAQWRTALQPAQPDGAYGPFPRIQSSPLVVGAHLYVAQSGGRVLELDANTGAVVWTSKPVFAATVKDVLRSSLRYYRGTLYVSLGGLGDVPGEWGGAAALDATTGRILWVTDLQRYTGAGAAVYGTPAIWPEAGLVYVSTGNPVIAGPQSNGALYSDSIVALRASDGHVAWAFQSHVNDLNDLDFIAAPNLFRLPDGTMAVGAGEKDGTYYAVDARTGQLLWKRSLDELGARTMILGTAASGQGLLFVGTEDVGLTVHAWPVNYDSPATGRIVALDPSTGRVIWERRLGGAVPIPPALVGRDLFVADGVGGIYVLDARTGRILWQGQVNGRLESASAGVAVAGDTLIVPLSEPAGVAGLHITWTSLLRDEPSPLLSAPRSG